MPGLVPVQASRSSSLYRRIVRSIALPAKILSTLADPIHKPYEGIGDKPLYLDQIVTCGRTCPEYLARNRSSIAYPHGGPRRVCAKPRAISGGWCPMQSGPLCRRLIHRVRGLRLASAPPSTHPPTFRPPVEGQTVRAPQGLPIGRCTETGARRSWGPRRHPSTGFRH